MPIPYIIGIPRTVFDSLAKDHRESWLQSDTVVFDVDKKTLIFEGENVFLPPSLTSEVIANMISEKPISPLIEQV